MSASFRFDGTSNLYVGGNLNIGQQLSVANNTTFSGSIGIGTTAPIAPLHVEGNSYINGNISSSNMAAVRNRVINGDMRIDQRNSGKTGTKFGPDRFNVVGLYNTNTVLPKQVALSDADALATGGQRYAASLTSYIGPTDGLIAYIPFDSATLSERIYDVMGYLTNPVTTGGWSSSTSDFILGSRHLTLFNGTPGGTPSTYITYSLASVTTTTTFTCWVKFSSFPSATNGATSTVFWVGTSSSSLVNCEVQYNSGTPGYYIYGSGGTVTGGGVTSNPVIATGVWYHVALVYIPGVSLQLYLNGVPGTATTTSINAAMTTSGYLMLGADWYASPQRAFSGNIDEFRIYNRALTGGEIASLASTTLYSIISSGSLTAWYPFDGTGSGLSSAIIGQFPGTAILANTAGTYSYVTGVTGNAIYFANEANIGASVSTKASNRMTAAVTQSGSITVSYWFYATKMPQNGSYSCWLPNFGNTTSGVGCYLAYISNTIANLYLWNGANNSSSTFVVNINTWYHVAFIINPSSASLFYVNGNYIGSARATVAAFGSSTSLVIGDFVVTANLAPFAGYIDDLRYYTRALTPAEIFYLGGNSTLYPSVPPAANLTVYYPFDGSINDSGTGGYNLTSTGTISYVSGANLFGTQCLYLTNEANVSAGTAAANYLTAAYTYAASFTVSFWAYHTAFSTNATVAFSTNNGASPANNSVYVRAYQGSYSAGFHGGNVTSGIGVALNTWNHHLIVFSNGTLYYYNNGTLIGSVAGTFAGSGIMFGNHGTSSTNTFAGYIDEFRVYSGALTQSQISALFYTTANRSGYTATAATQGMSLSSAAVLYQQNLDIINNADLAWGTGIASPVAVSCWVKNNTTGALPVTISLNNSSNLSYIYTSPSVSSGTWQKISFTVPAALAGTWTSGINVNLCLGASSGVFGSTGTWTNSSNLQYTDADPGFMIQSARNIYITGVQLEKGNLVTPFDFRNYTTELLMNSYTAGTYDLAITGTVSSSALITSGHSVPFDGTTANRDAFLKWLSSTTTALSKQWWSRATTPTYSTISGAPGTGAYWGGVLLPDGRVVFVPSNATTIGIFNPTTNTYSTIAGAPGNYAYLGGVLLPDGRVVFVPHNATTVGIFNPSTNAYSTIAGAPGSAAYIGGVLLPDGRVVFVPYVTTTIGIFNPSTNTYSTIAGTPGGAAYFGGVLLPDGRVVFVPATATTIGIFNPSTNTYSTIAVGAPGNYAYAGGVLLPDGRVVFVPHNATTIGIFNPSTNTYSTIAGAPGNAAYYGGVLLSDGRVIFVPTNSTTIGIFNPSTNTYSTIAVSPGSYTYSGAVLLPDGRAIIVPSNATTIGILSGFPRPPPELCYHPCFNKY